MNALAVLSSRECCYAQSRQEFEDVIRHLDSEELRLKTHSELERELEKMGRELMRKLLQEHLESRGPGQCAQPVKGSDGVERPRVRLQERKLETIFGTVSVERAGYGQEGNQSLHPLDAELNLTDKRYSLELCRRVAEEAAKNSFDETFESIGKITAGHVPKRQIEELVRVAARDFDAFYEMRQAQPDVEQTGSILAMSVDGKGVVMLMEDLREQTRKAAKARKHKMGARLSKGEKKNAKRMATVATVYTIEPLVREPEDLISGSNGSCGPPRPRPEKKRVWASLEKTPEEVIEKVFEEATSRDPEHHKSWVALVDGNKAQIHILRRMVKNKGIDLTIIVDVIHVIEYLLDAGRAFHSETCVELENWVRDRLLEILRGKAGYVAGGMRRSATLRSLTPENRKPVDACADYLLNHAPYLKYNHYLAQGFPIATGVIEGACRHLVKDRMEVTGARWSLAGAEAVLRLRALRFSHDLDEYWTFHEAQEYERNHRTLYTDGIVPSTLKPQHTPKSNRLKIIK
jgi:hypothetical protein